MHCVTQLGLHDVGKDVQRVDKFKFLGSIVTTLHRQTDSSSTTDIKIRLAIARQATLQLADVWKMKDISCDLKKQLCSH